jgi:hypothetical protein
MFFVLYVVAIYYSWNKAFMVGVEAGTNACVEALVEEGMLDRVPSGDGFELIGTVEACPKCGDDE